MNLSKEEPYEYPFQVSYQLENKHLTYVATLHSCEPKSDTFTMIRNIFESKNIDFVIVEGISHSDGVSPHKVMDWARKQERKGAYEGFETAFSVVLAAQIDIPFIGGEPDDSFILSQVLDEGYSREDLSFYYFVQQVFQSHENQTYSDATLVSDFNSFMQSKNRFFKFESLPTFSDFRSWYLNKNVRPFIASEITSEVPAPFENGGLFTQRISSSVCKIRDQFIVTCLGEAMSKYNSVLVIYGGSHWSTQKRSLEKTLGVPKFSKFSGA